MLSPVILFVGRLGNWAKHTARKGQARLSWHSGIGGPGTAATVATTFLKMNEIVLALKGSPIRWRRERMYSQPVWHVDRRAGAQRRGTRGTELNRSLGTAAGRENAVHSGTPICVWEVNRK